MTTVKEQGSTQGIYPNWNRECGELCARTGETTVDRYAGRELMLVSSIYSVQMVGPHVPHNCGTPLQITSISRGSVVH